VETSRTRGTGLILNLVALAAILPLAACIAHAPGNGGGGGQSQIVVTVNATTSTSVPVSTATTPSTVQLTASVTGTSNTAVTWSLAAAQIQGTTTCTATGAGLGSISGSGSSITYTAPGPSNLLPQSPCGIAVIATSAEDTGVSGQALVRVQAILALSPDTNTSLPVSTATTTSTLPLTATVTGATNTGVTWSLAPATVSGSTTCSATGAALGSITGTGNTVTYTAPGPPNPLPQSPCGVAITASAAIDNTLSAQELVLVHVAVSVSPITSTVTQAPETIGQGANLQYTATVAGAPTGSQGVNWSALCSSCQGQQGGGAFDANNPGLFVATPLLAGTTSATVAITATSAFDSSQSGTATLTVSPNDPLGAVSPTTAAAAEIPCPTFSAGLTGSTCYQLSVSCDQIADWTAYLKVNTPPPGTNQLGTVIFAADGGGSVLYDNDPNFFGPVNGQTINGGNTVVDGVLGSSYTTVQVSFGDAPFDTGTAQANGWLQGPGGVRRLACRFATVADWVSRNIHNSTTLPYCAVGDNGGAGAVAYAATAYGIASEFSLLEVTDGPVMNEIDGGCNVCGAAVGPDTCTQPQTTRNLCYSTSSGTTVSAVTIDTSYQAAGQTTPTLCSDGVNGVTVNGVSNPNANRFRSDSIEWESTGNTRPLQIPDPPTNIEFLLGIGDSSNAVPQAGSWVQALTQTPPIRTCIDDAGSAVPAVQDGAQMIVSDVANNCKLQ